MEGFVLLAYGFCASLVHFHGQEMIDLGKVVAGECDTFVYLGDSNGESAEIMEHDFSVSIFEGGAEVIMDGKKYVVPRTVGI